jgi:excisionase family DNA binding protein
VTKTGVTTKVNTKSPLLGSKPSPQELCTVAFAADRLKLHPKTVLRFIRERRLPATKVGKSYRILRADVDAFAGVAPPANTTADAAWITAIVDIPGVDAERARKWATMVPAALQGRLGPERSMRAEVVYEPQRSHLKIVVAGSPGDTTKLLGVIHVWIDQL